MTRLLLSKKSLACFFAFVACVASTHASLLHRFSFNDGKANDSVGKVSGVLKGAGATIADGQLVLKNTSSSTREAISHLEFSEPVLPKGGTSAGVVVWFSAKNTDDYSRVINFGDSEGTEGKEFIYFSPRTADGTARVAITGTDVGSKTYIDFDALDDGKPHMVAIAIDGASKKLRVFVDGQEPKAAEDLGSNTLDKVRPVENWLGKSSFTADPGLSASIDEIRVYDHALSADEAAAMLKAGPNALPAASTK